MNEISFDTLSVEILVGSSKIQDTPWRPFDDRACGFLAQLSKQLLKNTSLRKYPDVASFAYWCREKNILAHKTDARQNDGFIDRRLGRGLAFHVAPSNVPVNFAFSFAFSLLAGNANIVRLPSKKFVQVSMICDAAEEVARQYPDVIERMAFVRYSINDEITAYFSELADIRVIWGGDLTVRHIQELPHKPRCKDVLFPDRYSVSLIDARSIENATEVQLRRLAQDFYNDTYLMDQNACSSPQMVFWINASQVGKERFWDVLERVVKENYDLQDALSVDKYVQVCEEIIDEKVQGSISFNGYLTVLSLSIEKLPSDITDFRGVGGLFHECEVESFEEALKFVNERFQTLTYFGYEPDDIRQAILEMGIKGIDRIVPFGKAMDIDLIWDGQNLTSELSRIVDIR